MLTRHPEDATPAEDVTFLNCGPVEAVRIGRQLLGRIDEIDLHIASILLGEGIRLYDNPGNEPIRLRRLGDGDPTWVVNVRYRPTTMGDRELAAASWRCEQR